MSRVLPRVCPILQLVWDAGGGAVSWKIMEKGCEHIFHMLLVIGSKYSGFPARLFNAKTNKQNGVAGHLGLISALNLKMCYLSS